MHRSLAKQDVFIANVNLEILPVNEAPLPRISLRHLQACVSKSAHYEGVSRNSRTEAIAKYTTPNKRV
jgi:hypothetical protein